MKHSIQLIIGAIACFGFVTGAYAHYAYTCPAASSFKMVKGHCVTKQHNRMFYTPSNPGGKGSGTLCDTPDAVAKHMIIDKRPHGGVVISCHYSNGFYAYTSTKRLMKGCFVPPKSSKWMVGHDSCTCKEPGCVVMCAIKS